MKYVLVHGACHDGSHFEKTAAPIRAAGHEVFCPTVKGNRPGDDRKNVTLDDAIGSIVEYFDANNISDAVLVGHSWGGMVITGAADRLAPGRVRRLVYFSAFVPNNGESLLDMVPPHYQAMFRQMGEATGEIMFPLPILREAFINDGSAEEAQALFDSLNPQPYKTMNDKISLSRNPAEFELGKSYLLATEDTALPHSLPWHPRFPKSSVCSGWSRCRAATPRISPRQNFWVKRSWRRGATNPGDGGGAYNRRCLPTRRHLCLM